ncbi:unnamed protein product [Phytophthora lilii]|uniref:Unnamed protein product n=1 Tax=Phytophthora lilii TaxID=2077276 RepID=A0A9W6WP50_9STRA|nr:unnamed protein product [Phytophthora lilii]
MVVKSANKAEAAPAHESALEKIAIHHLPNSNSDPSLLDECRVLPEALAWSQVQSIRQRPKIHACVD